MCPRQYLWGTCGHRPETQKESSVSKFNRFLSAWLSRFSTEIRVNQIKTAAKATQPGGKFIETLESRRLLTAAITGAVYNDLNDNGLEDKLEPGIAGVTVYIDVNDTGSFAISDPTQVTR